MFTINCGCKFTLLTNNSNIMNKKLVLPFYLHSLDADSLFTNTPLDEAIGICVNQLFENTDTVERFRKTELKQLLCVVTKKSYFIFNSLLYKKHDSVVMKSPI